MELLREAPHLERLALEATGQIVGHHAGQRFGWSFLNWIRYEANA
jgi:hypothetical protein